MKTVFLLLISAAVIVSTLATAQDTRSNTSQSVYEASDKRITKPRPLYTPNPEYSESARKEKIRGYVTLSLIVTPEGSTRDITVTKSLEPSLNKQAIDCVSKWKFKPGTKDGNPVAVHVVIEIAFNVSD
jgi:TonB family protein